MSNQKQVWLQIGGTRKMRKVFLWQLPCQQHNCKVHAQLASPKRLSKSFSYLSSASSHRSFPFRFYTMVSFCSLLYSCLLEALGSSRPPTQTFVCGRHIAPCWVSVLSGHGFRCAQSLGVHEESGIFFEDVHLKFAAMSLFVFAFRFVC